MNQGSERIECVLGFFVCRQRYVIVLQTTVGERGILVCCYIGLQIKPGAASINNRHPTVHRLHHYVEWRRLWIFTRSISVVAFVDKKIGYSSNILASSAIVRCAGITSVPQIDER